MTSCIVYCWGLVGEKQEMDCGYTIRVQQCCLRLKSKESTRVSGSAGALGEKQLPTSGLDPSQSPVRSQMKLLKLSLMFSLALATHCEKGKKKICRLKTI